MDTCLYTQILEELKISARKFISDNQELSVEVEDDILSIINNIDIAKSKRHIDGVIKDVPELLTDLSEANKKGNRQACLGNIAMIRSAIADIENAFSNCLDSMEDLIVSIRDEKETGGK